MEALAAGAPLIVARTGGLAELVAGTNAGVTFEPGNPDDLADAIAQVLTNHELATILVANAKDLVEHKYAWGAIARTTSDVYTEAVDRRPWASRRSDDERVNANARRPHAHRRGG